MNTQLLRHPSPLSCYRQRLPYSPSTSDDYGKPAVFSDRSHICCVDCKRCTGRVFVLLGQQLRFYSDDMMSFLFSSTINSTSYEYEYMYPNMVNAGHDRVGHCLSLLPCPLEPVHRHYFTASCLVHRSSFLQTLDCESLCCHRASSDLRSICSASEGSVVILFISYFILYSYLIIVRRRTHLPTLPLLFLWLSYTRYVQQSDREDRVQRGDDL